MISIFFPSIIGIVILFFGFYGLFKPEILNSLFTFLLNERNRLLVGIFWLLAGLGLFMSASELVLSIFIYAFAILIFMDSLLLLLSPNKLFSTILSFITDSRFNFRYYFIFLIFCGLFLLVDLLLLFYNIML